MKLAAKVLVRSVVLSLLFAACTESDPPPDASPEASHEDAGDVVPPIDAAETEEIQGRWHRMRHPTRLTPEQQEEIERLRAIGYAAGSREAHTAAVVTSWDPTRAVDGLNFYTSGHAPAAYLVDMDGTVVHTWRKSFTDVWPDEPARIETGRSDFWRRAWLYDDGGVLAIFEGMGIVRLDRDSTLLWARLNGAHHDLEVLEDGTIVVLTRRAHLVERVHPQKPILEDFVTFLSPDGETLREFSIVEAFERSEFAAIGLRQSYQGGDITHTNTVRIVGPDDPPVPWLRPGYLLTSLRTVSVLAAIDLEREVVTHAWRGPFNRQHDPSVVRGDRLLLFDNVGLRTQSRVIEVALAAPDSIVWEYRGPEGNPLMSWTCGTVERLPGGNTLITDSDAGRALEIDADGELVWEYYNPHRVGTDPVYIATLFELERVPRTKVAWAE